MEPHSLALHLSCYFINNPSSLQAGSIGLVLTVLYLILILPVLLLYRVLEQDHEDHDYQEPGHRRVMRRPPPKYQECKSFL